MVTAFVLINVVDKKVHEAARVLWASDGVAEVHIIAGEYDLVAVVRVKDNVELSHVITHVIVNAPGVERTKTLFALESFSIYDLNAIFSEKP